MNYKQEAWYNPIMFTEDEDSKSSERNKKIIREHVKKFDAIVRRGKLEQN